MKTMLVVAMGGFLFACSNQPEARQAGDAMKLADPQAEAHVEVDLAALPPPPPPPDTSADVVFYFLPLGLLLAVVGWLGMRWRRQQRRSKPRTD